MSVLGHIWMNFLFVLDKNVLNLLDDTHVIVALVTVLDFVEVSSQNETVEGLHLPSLTIRE